VAAANVTRNSACATASAARPMQPPVCGSILATAPCIASSSGARASPTSAALPAGWCCCANGRCSGTGPGGELWRIVQHAQGAAQLPAVRLHAQMAPQDRGALRAAGTEEAVHVPAATHAALPQAPCATCLLPAPPPGRPSTGRLVLARGPPPLPRARPAACRASHAPRLSQPSEAASSHAPVACTHTRPHPAGRAGCGLPGPLCTMNSTPPAANSALRQRTVSSTDGARPAMLDSHARRCCLMLYGSAPGHGQGCMLRAHEASGRGARPVCLGLLGSSNMCQRA